MVVEQVVLEIARLSILNAFDGSFSFDKEALKKRYPILNNNAACFVTINLNGKLRGCIGSLVAHRPLLEDLVTNSKKAAFEDPRFKPLSYEEFKFCQIELSFLTPALKLQYKDVEELKSKVKVNEHGVILKHKGKQATYLPQVWEQIKTFDEFFDSLSKKAGFENSCLDENPEIYLYTAIKIK